MRTSSVLQLKQEMSCGRGRLRIDVHGPNPLDRVVNDMTFLDYRLANVKIEPVVTREVPDIVWQQDAPQKDIQYHNQTLNLFGEWAEGELQKILVSMLAMRIENAGCHPFHASAIRYRDRTVMFLGGESNSGKSMSQIEGSRRGARVVSTETVVTDEKGWVVMGSRNVFLRKRAKGTERADKPSQDQGIAKFFDATPEFVHEDKTCDVDLVILPDIDGNYDTLVTPLSQFEKEYQTFHCLMNYFGMHQLLAPRLIMPIIDTDALRKKRADFCSRFCQRPYLFIRGGNPQVILDEVERCLEEH